MHVISTKIHFSPAKYTFSNVLVDSEARGVLRHSQEYAGSIF
jgi:hypothetical protein